MPGRGVFSKLIVTAGVAAALLAAPGARATGPTTWHVDKDASGAADSTCAPCLTINGAIAKASDSDTVEVAVGVYTNSLGPVVDLSKNITVSGGWNSTFTSTTGLTTANGQDANRGVVAEAGTTSTLSRFHVFIGRAADLGGNVLVRGNLTLVDSLIENGHAPNGGGIATDSGYTRTTLHIVRSMIWANFATTGGGGISIAYATHVYAIDSTIAGNRGGGHGGGVDLADNRGNAAFSAYSSTIAANGATTGSGISIGPSTGAEIKNSILAGNDGGRDCATGGNSALDPSYSMIG